MPQPHITERAEADLQDIWDHVSADSVERADRLIEKIQATAAMLAESPRIGRPREDLLPGLRSLPFGNYVIFYWPIPDESRSCVSCTAPVISNVFSAPGHDGGVSAVERGQQPAWSTVASASPRFATSVDC